MHFRDADVSDNMNVIVIQSSKGGSMEDFAESPSQVVTELAPPSSFFFFLMIFHIIHDVVKSLIPYTQH